MPPSKLEANPTLRRVVKYASFSLFKLASSCANAYSRAYTIFDFLADRLVFLNTVSYLHCLSIIVARVVNQVKLCFFTSINLHMFPSIGKFSLSIH